MTGLVKFEDAPASLKSDMWKNFGFPMPRNEKGGKVTDKTTYKHWRIRTKVQLRRFVCCT